MLHLTVVDDLLVLLRGIHLFGARGGSEGAEKHDDGAGEEEPGLDEPRLGGELRKHRAVLRCEGLGQRLDRCAHGVHKADGGSRKVGDGHEAGAREEEADGGADEEDEGCDAGAGEETEGASHEESLRYDGWDAGDRGAYLRWNLNAQTGRAAQPKRQKDAVREDETQSRKRGTKREKADKAGHQKETRPEQERVRHCLHAEVTSHERA
mmetsp:Transcript_15426/g.50703  ORF Transcript_15426/g.50703 Transcript_15426/m.50703 type:complete len:209 (+) Transcript_15426:40-666(+)